MAVADQGSRFVGGAKRLTALELAKAQDAIPWNSWRQESDLFGDHRRTRINLATAQLSKLSLSKFNLTNVSFYRADLTGASLQEADCAFADFLECRLIGADLTRANLRNSRLARAYMRGAHLDYADLRGCDLRRVSMRACSLVGADIRGVDLSSARGLEDDQLVDAIGDSRTRLPSHLTPPDTWERYESTRDRDDEDLEHLRIVPASVEVAVVSGIVQLSRQPGDAYFSSTADPEMLRAEIVGDLHEVVVRCSNVPSLHRAISQYLEELSSDEFDIIKVGTRGVRLEAVFSAIVTSDSDSMGLLPDAVGIIRAVIIQHYLFVGQSHRWKAFLEEASYAPYSGEVAASARSVGEQVIEILESHPTVCEAKVPAALESVAQEVDIGDDAHRLAIFNIIASVENVFKSVVTWLVKEAKRLIGDSWESFRKGLAATLGVGMAALVTGLIISPVATGLAAKYPERFAWLTHAIELIKAANGGS